MSGSSPLDQAKAGPDSAPTAQIETSPSILRRRAAAAKARARRLLILDAGLALMIVLVALVAGAGVGMLGVIALLVLAVMTLALAIARLTGRSWIARGHRVTGWTAGSRHRRSSRRRR